MINVNSIDSSPCETAGVVRHARTAQVFAKCAERAGSATR